MKSRSSDSGRGSAIRRVLGGAAALALGVSVLGGVALVNAPDANAIVSDLPTWNDVQQAKNDQASAAKKVTEIEALIVQVQNEVAQTQAELEAYLRLARQTRDVSLVDLPTPAAPAAPTEAELLTQILAELRAQRGA